MKAQFYASKFGVLHLCPIKWRGGELQDLLDCEANPDYELDDLDLHCLYMAEFHSLSRLLEKWKDEKSLIRWLRDAFDEYRVNGGDAEIWVNDILNELDVNPQLFPAEFRGVIAENVMRWDKKLRQYRNV
jgi:hypothetical protein